jgi:flavorubredoxin
VVDFREAAHYQQNLILNLSGLVEMPFMVLESTEGALIVVLHGLIIQKVFFAL